ncbi:hypothetical protein OIU74_004445 [Salix koriyanagi]|uniref:Protein kinase domain-containing protein n=1 Tax=Salix koriyanagi TaxID=2511006 RepID=A0A9Q0V074_9ROSI|nr:hypothetical protein OIU74_004445 [Salix koriyanagi]
MEVVGETPPASAGEVILFGKYEIGKLLGYGAFAKVYHARNVSTGQSVAIKAVSKAKVMKGGFVAHVKREISIMRRLRHANIVKLHEVFGHEGQGVFRDGVRQRRRVVCQDFEGEIQ